MSDVKTKISSFFEAFPVLKLKSGDRLLTPDDQIKKVYFLRKGLVKQYDISVKGNEVVVNIFKKGAYFPLYIELTGIRNQYFFDAMTDCELSVAPVKDVTDFVTSQSDVMLELLQRVYRGAVGQQRRMAHLMGGSAAHRLLFELVVAAKRFGEDDGSGRIKIALHEDDLAGLTGLSRETISREMRNLKSSGNVIIQHKNIIVTDLAQLEILLDDTL